MRIGIDIRCLAEGRRTGVEEYALNLLETLFSLDKENQYILFFNSFRKPKIIFEWIKPYPNVSVRIFRFPNKILNLLLWYWEWPKIDKLIGGVDLFFMPNINFGSFSYSCRMLLTVHDLSFEICPETFSWKRRLWHTFVSPKKLARKARKIVVVSESTKSDVEKIYNIAEDKIKVIRSGVADKFSRLNRNAPRLVEVKKRYRLPYKFIFCLGTIEPRKNIVALVKAYEQIRRLNNPQLDKYKLVIAGEKGWKSEKIFRYMENSPFRKDIMIVGRVREEDKVEVFNLASLFVYPSVFEGFGFPAAEAMKCGVPLIASNSSALPELVGDGGILIDPEKPDEIFQAMKDVLLDRKFSETLAGKGPQKAAQYSWKNAAKELLILFDEVAFKKRPKI